MSKIPLCSYLVKKLPYTSVIILMFSFSYISFGQSIVNTEKLFLNEKSGFRMSSELVGNFIAGNANIAVFEFTGNFAYKKNNHILHLISGGEYVGDGTSVATNAGFAQMRYNYVFKDSTKVSLFYQIQQNKILLLNRRMLIGTSYRMNIASHTKKSNNLKFDVSLGVMQEEEILNENEISASDRRYSNFTRGLASLFLISEFKNVRIINSTFYQHYILSKFDFRLLNETNVLFKINDWLNLSIDFEIRYDNEPPSILTNFDLNTNIGFLFEL